MPLSRNLYELDEVVSALQVCLRNGWPRALFWLQELVTSEEETLASQTLIDTWLRYGGGVDSGLLNERDWINRCVRTMAAIQTAGSLYAMRFLTLTLTLPSRPSMTPLPRSAAIAARRAKRSAAFVASLDPSEQVSLEDAANFWISLDSACRQGSRTDAFWLLQAAQPIFSADAIWSALRIASRGPICGVQEIQRAATNPHPIQQLLFQASATLHLCIPSQERAAYVPPRGAQMQRQAWTANVGRRKSRLYAIPVEALHANSTRGRIPHKYTNIDDLRDPVQVLSEGCTFWQNTLRSNGIEIDKDTGATVFPDDTALESFYDTYFPDDIPDEWSMEDQLKSHGRGVQETAPPAPVEPPIRETPVSRRAWNCGIHVRRKKS